MDRWFSAFVKCKGYLYWITEIGSHFMRLNLQTKRIEYVQPKGGQIISEKSRNAVLCAWNDNVIIVLNKGESIAIFNVKDNSLSEIQINAGEMNLDWNCLARVIGNSLWIIPRYYGELLEIDLIKKNAIKYPICESDGNQLVFSTDSNQTGEKLSFVTIRTNERIIFDTNSKKIVSRFSLSDKINAVVNYLDFEKQTIYLDNGQNLYRYKGQTVEFLGNISTSDGGYHLMEVIKNSLWIFPLFDEVIYRINLKKPFQKEIISFDDKRTMTKAVGKYTRKVKVGNKVYLSMHAGSKIVYFNKDNEKIEEEFVEWPSELECIEELIFQQNKALYEEKVSLESYISYIENL